MKKKVLSMLFLLFMVVGVFVSVANFSTALNANAGGPDDVVWGTWEYNPECWLGFECIENTIIDCFARGDQGCRD